MTQPDADGALLPARRQLEDAIHRLCGPQSRFIDGKLLYSSSRYLTLMDATSGEQSNAGGGGGSKSQPPCWLDAVELLAEIDLGIEILQPAFTGVPPTVGRLKWLEQRKWRPQDTGQIERITRAVAEWAQAIDELLDPPTKWTLPYPCPRCGKTTVYRKDSAGEFVRQPALHLDPEWCRCVGCHAAWPKGEFKFLGKLLGRPSPEGVLE